MTEPAGTACPLLWGNLLHLSYNMWNDYVYPDPRDPYLMYQPYLRFDESLWNDLLRQMVQAGMNLVVLDLGDGVRYESHPEIAVQNAWTPDKAIARANVALAKAQIEQTKTDLDRALVRAPVDIIVGKPIAPRRMAEHIRTLLDGAPASPDSP